LQQKLVIGDDSGQLTCFEFKKGEPQVVFQSKIFDGAISSVATGGVGMKRDRVSSSIISFSTNSLTLFFSLSDFRNSRSKICWYN
jgi:hypothetical protein